MSQPPGPLRPVPFEAVADHTFVASVPFLAADGPAEVTVGLVVGRDAALLVDTGPTRSRAAGCGRPPRR